MASQEIKNSNNKMLYSFCGSFPDNEKEFQGFMLRPVAPRGRCRASLNRRLSRSHWLAGAGVGSVM
jgi:hypothetical protein